MPNARKRRYGLTARSNPFKARYLQARDFVNPVSKNIPIFEYEARHVMYSTQYLFRIAKTIAVAAIGLMALLIVIGNTTDYFTNYHFVEHVLKMDTVFPDSNIHYRSISSAFLYHAGYILIIAMETMMAFCCTKGAWLLARNLKGSAAVFHSQKNWAVAGITIGMVIWFLGFEVVGGEWFSMWQSHTWNGLASAERIVSFLVLVLILLHFKEDDL
jgi:predicted small integral membrane protein